MENYDFLVEEVRRRLSPGRFQHSLRVLDTALSMKENAELEKDKVYLAALLHDYAKELPKADLLALARENGLLTCKAEEVQPDLLHGPVGAWLCENSLGIKDQDVLEAIRYHTTGRAGMSLLEKVIYLADLLEPGRVYNGVEVLRKKYREGLSAGMLFAFDSTIAFVLERKLLIHPFTVEGRNWLLLKDTEESE
jgi:predicted HD superfamily hydrolase involved in NAD metabolism